MKGIKFRAWYENEMCKVFDITFVSDGKNNITLVKPNGDFVRTFINHVKLIQYTGLKDKNGKEIYEKNIVKGFGKIFVVKYGIVKRRFEGDWLQIPSFYFDHEGEALYPILKNHLGKNDLEELEVIGDIHSSPELLEGVKEVGK